MGMTKVPADYQTVTTFVPASYKRHYHGYTFYTFAFMAVCLAAMLCSIVLTTCVCYKVCRRVCAHCRRNPRARRVGTGHCRERHPCGPARGLRGGSSWRARGVGREG